MEKFHFCFHIEQLNKWKRLFLFCRCQWIKSGCQSAHSTLAFFSAQETSQPQSKRPAPLLTHRGRGFRPTLWRRSGAEASACFASTKWSGAAGFFRFAVRRRCAVERSGAMEEQTRTF